ncbi:MAG: ABC transporter ATP-binding protein [Candidatus Cloacimonetes bacterium]|nr:ABC transporter ATP-binding protein [Candidatus Cloacimonadota bacterium]
MILKDTTKRHKTTTPERKRIIDNVTQLYVHFLRRDVIFDFGKENLDISLDDEVIKQVNDEVGSENSNEDSIEKEIGISNIEINILYSLLINIFRRETISWEIYIREVVSRNIHINHVISYLNEHLIAIDKIRILLSLIIMTSSNNDYSLPKITKILELAKKLDLETDGFMEFFNNLEHKSLDHLSIKEHIKINAIETSIFSDYVSFGRDDKCQIQFFDKLLNGVEFVLFMIDQYIFIATNNRVSAYIDDKKLAPFNMFLIPRHSIINVSGIEFNSDNLVRLYKNQDNQDEIIYKRDAFDFKIINDCNRFSLVLYRGIIYQNKEQIPKNKTVELLYDDVFHIKGIPSFNVFEFLSLKNDIGNFNTIPDELYIDHQAGFFSLSRVENTNSIIHIEISNHKHYLHLPLKKTWVVYLNNIKITEPTLFYLNTDIITINKNNFRINNFYDLVEIPFELENINVLDIKHFFTDGTMGLDGISFEIEKGEILGILGQSGCGKSSLLKSLCGEIIPTYGSIMYDGKDYYQNIGFFSQYVGYVPQDDILFTHLTVYENLYYRGKLRIPKITDAYLEQKIMKILINTNLIHKKNTKVGDFKNKYLSGGERKRLNLALELLFDPTFLICDEPTSGLSYIDAEQIIDILKQYTEQGKFVLLTIHQPNTTVFHIFDKILIMDRGGKQVFFGKPNEVWTYFDMEFEQICPPIDDSIFPSPYFDADEPFFSASTFLANKTNQYNADTQASSDKENIIQNSPLEVLKQKKHDKLPEYLNLIVEYPEYKDNGEIVFEKFGREIMIKRKFSPEYWRDKYKRKMLFDLIQFDSMRAKTNKMTVKKKEKKDLQTRYTHLKVFIKRNTIMKLRNHSNMFITFGQVIVLAMLIAFILRLAPANEAYSFNQNINIGIFIFISVIIFIFLGMSNSMEEILSEKKNFIREKMLNIKVSYFLSSKISVLCLFSAFQVAIYLLIANAILAIEGMFPIYFTYLFVASLIGCSLGVFISTFLSDSKSLINIIPLILIPQIIFGGAIIEYEKMNRQITLIDTNPIPEIVKTMPSYWLFEGLYTSQAKLNKHDRMMNVIDKQRQRLLKDNQSTSILNDKTEEIHLLFPRRKYQNEYISLAVNIMDGRLLNTRQNVFLSSMKWLGNITVPTYIFNLFILILYAFIINIASILKLKFFYSD